MFLMQNFFQSPDTYGVNIVASMIFADRDDAYAEMHKQAEDSLTNYYNDENYNDENIELEDDGDQVHVKGPSFSDSWVVSEITDKPMAKVIL